jgi:hypothetical protein
LSVGYRRPGLGPRMGTMDAEVLQALKFQVDKIAKITCFDGEVIVAKILFVSEPEEDVIYDLVSTSRESQYEKHDEQPAYRLLFRDIKSVEGVSAKTEESQ